MKETNKLLNMKNLTLKDKMQILRDIFEEDIVVQVGVNDNNDMRILSVRGNETNMRIDNEDLPPINDYIG